MPTTENSKKGMGGHLAGKGVYKVQHIVPQHRASVFHTKKRKTGQGIVSTFLDACKASG